MASAVENKQLSNLTKNVLVLEQLEVADRFWSRARGLLGRSHLSENQGLWILRTNSIHTFFMNFSIDCIFVNKHMKVVGLRKTVRPWRLVTPVWRAAHVIEVSPGTIEQKKIELGDQLHVVG